MTKTIAILFAVLGLVACSSSPAGTGGSGSGFNPPPVATKVLIINTGSSSITLRVLATTTGGGSFAYRPDTLLAANDSILVRYNFDTVHTGTDTVTFLHFTTPPRLQEVLVNIRLGSGIPEPADTVLRVAMSASPPVVSQPTCTDLGFDGRSGLICKQVTVTLVDRVTGDAAAASIGDGHITIASGGCFSGWTVTDPTVDSVSVVNYASSSAAMFGGASYGTFWVSGQQGPTLTEQLDSLVAGQPYWTVTHTGSCP